MFLLKGSQAYQTYQLLTCGQGHDAAHSFSNIHVIPAPLFPAVHADHNLQSPALSDFLRYKCDENWLEAFSWKKLRRVKM